MGRNESRRNGAALAARCGMVNLFQLSHPDVSKAHRFTRIGVGLQFDRRGIANIGPRGTLGLTTSGNRALWLLLGLSTTGWGMCRPSGRPALRCCAAIRFGPLLCFRPCKLHLNGSLAHDTTMPYRPSEPVRQQQARSECSRSMALTTVPPPSSTSIRNTSD